MNSRSEIGSIRSGFLRKQRSDSQTKMSLLLLYFGFDVYAVRLQPLAYRVRTKRSVLCSQVGFENLSLQPWLMIVYRLVNTINGFKKSRYISP